MTDAEMQEPGMTQRNTPDQQCNLGAPFGFGIAINIVAAVGFSVWFAVRLVELL